MYQKAIILYMQDIIDSLSNFGLSEKEALTYVTLLRIGKSNVKKIATKSGLKRPTVYVLLEELRKKEFVLQIPISNKVMYEARDPKEIKELINDKFQKFNQSYFILENIKANKESFNTFYYEGNSGLKNAYNYKFDTLKNKQIIGFGAKAENTSKESFKTIFEFSEKLFKNNISYKGITVKHPSVELDNWEYPEIYKDIKILSPEIYSSDISIEACGDFVRIIDFAEEKAVIVDSKKFSEALENIYKLVEKGLEK